MFELYADEGDDDNDQAANGSDGDGADPDEEEYGEEEMMLGGAEWAHLSQE